MLPDRAVDSGGREDSHMHIKRTGVLVGNFERAPKSYEDPVLWAWLEMFITPRDTNSKITTYLLSYLFRLITLNGTANSPF